MQLGSSDVPSVRCAGQEKVPRQGVGTASASAWSIRPRRSSSIVTVPAAIGRLDADEPQFQPSVAGRPSNAMFE